ncbi:MAG TPA: SBBP repeat-containing protein, partial [Candidatus Deferrimicrobium sp.]|nr:SBBP repeat-containing protein [Candidatus Deferrimicrobium sp.]
MKYNHFPKMKKICLTWLFIATFLMGILMMGVLSNKLVSNPRAIEQINTDSAMSVNTILFKNNWTFGDSSDDEGFAIARGPPYLYLAGITDKYGTYDVTLIKSDPSGNPLWTKYWVGDGVELVEGIAVDGSGNIYITGQTSSYGSGILNLFLLKYNSGGTKLWNYTWSHASKISNGHDIVFDGSDNVYVVGSTNHLGTYDLVVIKYNSTGTELWNTTWGGVANSEYGWGIAIDGSTLYVAGGTKSYGSGGVDLALIKISATTGAVLDTEIWGGSKDDSINSIIVESNYIYLAGTTSSYGAGGSDIVVLKYDLNLNRQWYSTYGGSGTTNETCHGIAHYNN